MKRAAWALSVCLSTGCGLVLSTERYCVGSECFDTEAEAQAYRDTRAASRHAAQLEAVAAGAEAERARLGALKAAQAEEERRRAAERGARLAERAERLQLEARELAELEAREATARARLDDPTFAGLALSALLCEREADLAELRTEASGATTGAQRRRIEADRENYEGYARAYRAALVTVGASRAPCPAVAPALSCFLRRPEGCGARLALGEGGEAVTASDVADVMRHAPGRWVGLR